METNSDSQIIDPRRKYEYFSLIQLSVAAPPTINHFKVNLKSSRRSAQSGSLRSDNLSLNPCFKKDFLSLPVSIQCVLCESQRQTVERVQN